MSEVFLCVTVTVILPPWVCYLTQGKVCFNALVDDMFQAIDWLEVELYMCAQNTCTQQVHVRLLIKCAIVCMCTHCVVGTCLSMSSTHLVLHR